MPCHRVLAKKIKKITLQVAKKSYRKTFPPTDVRKHTFGRVSPCILVKKQRLSGSLTVEAALLLPLFCLGMLALISVMNLYQIQSQMTVTLNETAKELGVYAYAARNHFTDAPLEVVSDGACIAYAKAKLNPKQRAGVTINLNQSRYHDSQIELVADIAYHIEMAPFPLPVLRIRNWAKVHDWTGYSPPNDHEGQPAKTMVYITDRQTVYHTFSQCSHLQLSIKQMTQKQVADVRNKNGEKYYSCPHCTKAGGTSPVCYITEQGNRYHFSSSCQSLTRKVKMVEAATVGDKRECQRCAQRGENYAK